MMKKRERLLLLAFYALISVLLTGCNAYKKLTLGNPSIYAITDFAINNKSVEAVITLSVPYDNQSGAKFSLKNGNVKLFKGSDNLFAELTTGQSPVLMPHTMDTVMLECKGICYKPATFLLVGLSAVNNIITDDMLVSVEAVAAQGSITKDIIINETPVSELKQLFLKNDED